LEVGTPSIYSDMVWECRKARMQADQGMIDWVVMKNRTSHLFARNRERVEIALNILSKRLGFRLVTGLSERVIFREMFPAGLTLLDLTENEANANLTMSHVAARTEIRNIIKELQLPGVQV
jgi:chromosome partitioning protein